MMRSFLFKGEASKTVGVICAWNVFEAACKCITVHIFKYLCNCVHQILAFTARGAIVVVHPEYWAVSIKPKQQPILVSNHGGHGAETSPEKGDVAKV